jgi:dihydrodipicolinate synthase/N-acetylneuraminate lyase
MFEKARKAEAGKFADVVLGVGQNLEEALKEALSAKRLQAEGLEECPPQYRPFVNAYYEALSKAAGTKSR